MIDKREGCGRAGLGGERARVRAEALGRVAAAFRLHSLCLECACGVSTLQMPLPAGEQYLPGLSDLGGAGHAPSRLPGLAGLERRSRFAGVLWRRPLGTEDTPRKQPECSELQDLTWSFG